MTESFHVASLLVYAKPSQVQQVSAAIGQRAGATLHGSSPEGKLIVVIESSGEGAITESLNAISALPGVLTAVLIYHEVDEEGDDAPGPEIGPSKATTPSSQEAAR